MLHIQTFYWQDPLTKNLGSLSYSIGQKNQNLNDKRVKSYDK